jgi:hypothetical protein
LRFCRPRAPFPTTSKSSPRKNCRMGDRRSDFKWCVSVTGGPLPRLKNGD